jgi:hypothetical protein
MKKVIYISHAHLSTKMIRDWYIDHLQECGVIVEFWDLIPLLFGEKNEAGAINREFIFIPSNYGEIEMRLRHPANRSATYIMMINYGGPFVRLYRLLSKYNCKIYFMAWGAFPYRKTSKWLKTINQFSAPLNLIKKVFYKVKGLAYRKLKLIKPFDVVFGAGYAILKSFPDAGKVVPTNLPDYDQYMKAKIKTNKIVEGRYAVFLDIYLPFQSDLAIVGLEPVNGEGYFSSLNRFFDDLEKIYEVKIVIAAHPKSDYKAETFQGRSIFHGQTPELVSNADFVISHHSTSISYAVLNLKPTIFIYTDEMKRLYKDTCLNSIQAMASYLAATIYNIDDITQFDKYVIGDVNVERYENYKYDFLTTRESEHVTAQEIFLHEIMKD